MVCSVHGKRLRWAVKGVKGGHTVSRFRHQSTPHRVSPRRSHCKSVPVGLRGRNTNRPAAQATKLVELQRVSDGDPARVKRGR